MNRTPVGLVVAAAALLAPASARASQVEGNPPGLFGPIRLEAAANATVDVQPGLGGRVGASYHGLYGGLAFTDYVVDACAEVWSGGCSAPRSLSYGVEVGYGGLTAKYFFARAHVGFGDYSVHTEGTNFPCAGPAGPCTPTPFSSTTHTFVIEPGALLALAVGPLLAGVDVGLFWLPSITPVIPGGSSSLLTLRFGLELGVRL